MIHSRPVTSLTRTPGYTRDLAAPGDDAIKPQPVALPAGFDRPQIVRLPDGSLEGYRFLEPCEPHEKLGRILSPDNGVTWSEPQPVVRIGADSGHWGSVTAVADREGEVHLAMMNDRFSGVFGEPPEGQELVTTGPSHGRWIDVWHMRSSAGRTRWNPPQLIWRGFTGSINSAIQTSKGRIVVPFGWETGQSWTQRAAGFDAFHFHGSEYSTVMYSDNGGASWAQGTLDIKAWAPITGFGAIEPVIIELQDGRVWMLIRTQNGRLYESFSDDGATWSVAQPTRLVSSDSPVGMVRLSDGRLILLWNCCQRYAYAYGGRHVLHGAVSDDDGQTWRGRREVARDPRRDEPPPEGGDFGTAYPNPVATIDDHVIFATGQGEGRTMAMRLDPAWLDETSHASDFSDGLDDWSIFGTQGVQLREHPDRSDARALHIRKELPGATAAAVWNFPAGRVGTITLRVRLDAGAGPFRISLTDHFSTPFDDQDQFHSTFNLPIEAGGGIGTLGVLEPDRWHDLDLAWDTVDQRRCAVRADGHELATLAQEHATDGVNYLRVVSTAESRQGDGLWLESAAVDAKP